MNWTEFGGGECRCRSGEWTFGLIGQIVLLLGDPVPGEEFVELAQRESRDASRNIGEASFRVDVVELGGAISVYIAAARTPPRSDPATRHGRIAPPVINSTDRRLPEIPHRELQFRRTPPRRYAAAAHVRPGAPPDRPAPPGGREKPEAGGGRRPEEGQAAVPFTGTTEAIR